MPHQAEVIGQGPSLPDDPIDRDMGVLFAAIERAVAKVQGIRRAISERESHARDKAA